MRSLTPIAVVVALGTSLACGASREMDAPGPMNMETTAAPPPPPVAEEAEGGAMTGGRAGKAKGARGRPEAERKSAEKVRDADGDDGVADNEAAPPGAEPERVRSWFPEAFLWQPLVVTGDDGSAAVPLTVPDSLTTWRVLALAHDRSGQQTGTVATFDSTLPVYVDPVVPGWLFAGDRLVLPVQLMNTTAEAVAGTLTVEATGPVTGLGTAAVTLPAGGSDLRAMPLQVTGAGEARVTARFRGGDTSDAAERTIPVRPSGRPVVSARGGTLTDTRTLTLPAAPGADPATQELEVRLFGGPLAVVESELARLGSGARPENAAYGFALTGRAEALGAAAGVEVDAGGLRKVRLLAWQRVVREARAADAGRATDLLQAMQGELGVEAAGPVRDALLRAVVGGQRADGTWGRRPDGTLQEVLVNTAWSGRVLPADQPGSRLRASAALERYLHEVKDPYTAAVLAASGLLPPEATGRLRDLLADGARRDEDGQVRIDLPPQVVDPWGVRPSAAEVAAFAVLAWKDDPDPGHAALRRDLAGALLAGWSASWGFGAGPADPLALEAVVDALPADASGSVVSVLADGVVVASGRFDPKRPGDPLLLQSRPPSGAELTLRAEPPVAGVAFVATRRSWVPWAAGDRIAGVDLEITPSRLQVGETRQVAVRALAPSGRRLRVEVPLPAGAVPDAATLRAQNPSAQVEVATDRVIWTTAAFRPAASQTLTIPVTPAFGGDFSTEPVMVSVDGAAAVPHRPPRFRVAGPAGS